MFSMSTSTTRRPTSNCCMLPICAPSRRDPYNLRLRVLLPNGFRFAPEWDTVPGEQDVRLRERVQTSIASTAVSIPSGPVETKTRAGSSSRGGIFGTIGALMSWWSRVADWWSAAWRAQTRGVCSANGRSSDFGLGPVDHLPIPASQD